MHLGFLPIIPFLSALAIYFFCSTEKKIYRVSLVSSFITLILSLLLLFEFLSSGIHEISLLGSKFVSFLIDPLSVVMSLTISAISLLVHAYSVRYLQDDDGYKRFFILLDLMTACLLFTVLSGNLLLLFAGWHLIGVLLYLLLGHNLKSKPAGRYGLWTFMTHRLGDVFLLSAIVILFSHYGTFEIRELFDKILASTEVPKYFGLSFLEIVGILVVLSAFAKSAQFPLHLWLPYTMEGPTPVSALMHAGIVNAGGFLINRFAPVFFHAEVGLHLAFWIGLITAILGSTLMLMQSDIKKSLGYSTVGQMGYMVMECGVGAFSLAIYHLIAHGIFKATLFMGSGSVIHQARKDPNIPEDEVYKFLVEREMPPPKLPWFVFALITISVPLAIVFFAHMIAGVDVFKYQGALILLFFGWITGAQTIFSIYRIRSGSVYKLLLFVILSFSVVVLGYVVIGHSFEKFLYPDRNLIDGIYKNANINPAVFEVQIALLALIIVIGWILVYYRSTNRGGVFESLGEMRVILYTYLSRELYLQELYSRLGVLTETLSSKLNRVMRWL